MTTDATPLFGSTALAERIERVETQMITTATEFAGQRVGAAVFVVPIAGGAACYAGEGSPLNKVVGLGFGGAPDGDALEAIEHEFAARGAATRVELTNLADPAIGAALTARGYQLVSFENVLGRSLDGDMETVTPPGVEVRPSDDRAAWLEVVIDGFAHPDEEGVPAHEDFPRETIENVIGDTEQAGAKPYLARRDGVVAGGASMRISEGIAQLTGAATSPAHRRRGVQTALLAARLADAARAGCDIAVVTTAPGSKSQQNVARRGFHLLYTRAVLVKG
ncbi:GNAT family acetyltransferase [Mycobacterium sp. ACS1612]|uniref:GNAT family N-acetyltransferase n=1 Tax=Mycobacterium sp. ACS1612 TaxID=1834117 RepID=UPI0007FF4A1C|nr:GNAT family N-acetyltransferase [Mycobacterium sp. ACS1612]OBF29005.1 GNAT family acetyltransferase [Mycobacterium sp. ACS1612]